MHGPDPVLFHFNLMIFFFDFADSEFTQNPTFVLYSQWLQEPESKNYLDTGLREP